MPAWNQLLLHANCPQALIDAGGSELRAVSGVVWITETGAAGDVFLRAGESHRLQGKGPALIEALRGEARIELRGTGRRSWRRMLRRAFGNPGDIATPVPCAVSPAPTSTRRNRTSSV